MVRVSPIKFPISRGGNTSSVIEMGHFSFAIPSRGWDDSGGAILSSNNQVMTITNQGRCGYTYFTYFDSNWELKQGDNHPVLGEQLLVVTNRH